MLDASSLIRGTKQMIGESFFEEGEKPEDLWGSAGLSGTPRPRY